MLAQSDDPLPELARRHGRRRALVDRGAGFWVTWGDLDGLAGAWARRFEAAGLRTGERVAVIEPAGIRLAALLHACLRSRAALVPLSPRAPDAVVEGILADSRPRLLVRGGELERLASPATGAPDDACVLYTSGTTGVPKGVRLTLANHAASAAGCRRALGSGFEDRWLLALPAHHVGGLAILFRGVLGNQPVITLPGFQEVPVLEAMREERPTLVSLVPTMLTRLLAAGGLDALRGLRAILVGGGPIPADQVREWLSLGLRVCPSYGLTETCSQIAVVPPGEADRLAGAAGRIGHQARVEIVAHSGEIVVSGACLSPGYLNPAVEPAIPDGRFHTGDLGRLQDGVLTVRGRLDDTISTGGENVRPEEVEAALLAHPAVRDVAVAGQEDAVWGQVVAAWVVGEGATVGELEAWCRQRVDGVKVPRRWRFVDGLPRGEGGKLLRRELA